MSDRWWRPAILLCAALGIPGTVESQSTAALQERFARLSDSAAVLRAQINAREARKVVGVPDSLRHAGLTVVTRGEMPKTLPAALPLAWQRLVSRFGDRRATAAVAVAIDAAEDPQLRTLTFRPAAPAGRGSAARGKLVRLASLGLDSLAEVIAAVASRDLWAGTDSVLVGWRESADPVWTAREVSLESLYENLVASPWVVPRRCFLGDLAACHGLLALDPASHVMVASYTPEEREVVVGRMIGYVSGRVMAQTIGACLSRHDTEQCTRVLVETFPAPWSHRGALGAPARQALLAIVLEMGGSGAFEALNASAAAPMGERLARAAGVPLDSLLTRWRNEILAARPQPVSVTSAGGWTAVGWAALLGLMALRSSRWR